MVKYGDAGKDYCNLAYVKGDLQRVYLSSKIENLYNKGFVKFAIDSEGKGTYSVSYYHPRENIAMALKVCVFLDPKYSILKHPTIKKSLKNEDVLTLFERDGSKINFWGLLVDKENMKRLYVPIIDDYKLIFPWRSFDL